MLLDTDEPSVRPIAGGTAVMLMMKMGVFQPARLVSLRSIEKQYSSIECGPAGELRFGAMTTLAALERSPAVKSQAPVISRVLRTLSNVRVRNVANVGGHLAHADPHMDLPPLQIALGASVSTLAPKGSRTLPLEQLYTGYLETTLGRGELIAAVTVPPQNSWRAAYLTCTLRSADDWPALGVAVALDTDGAAVRDARVVVSAATDRPTRLASVEAAESLKIDSDLHGSAAYKKQLLRVYLKRAIDEARNARH